MKNFASLKSACKSLEEDLVLYYYGENSEADGRRVERHLAECVCCRRFVDDLRGLLPQMAKSQELPQAFWDSYFRETVAKLREQEERKFRWREVFTPMKSWLVPAIGTAAVTILAIGLVLGKGTLPSFIGKASESLPQEVIADANQLEFFTSLDMLESLSRLEEQEGGKIEPPSDRSSLSGTEQAAA